jgi:hypothetical protein
MLFGDMRTPISCGFLRLGFVAPFSMPVCGGDRWP